MRSADSSQLVRIAHLYYHKDVKQSDIAAEMGMSRQSVGRALKLAKELRLVQIRIVSPIPTVSELERALEDTFHLKEAHVCRPVGSSDEAVKEALGSLASDFLLRNVRNGQVIGISWGSTMLRLVSEMPKVAVTGVTVVQLDGSTDQTPFPTSAQYIVQSLAAAMNAESITLSVPLVVDTQKIRDELVTDSRIAHALQTIRKADITLVGIGDVSSDSNLYKTGYLHGELIEELRSAKAVGEICGHYFDIQGNACLPSLSARTIAIDLRDLRTRAISVAVAGGAGKVDAILGALAGKFCNVLITDEVTASTLLVRNVSVASERRGRSK